MNTKLTANQAAVIANIKAGRAWNEGVKFAPKTAMALERAGLLVRASAGEQPVCFGLVLAPEYR
jgi:hypothetical protein